MTSNARILTNDNLFHRIGDVSGLNGADVTLDDGQPGIALSDDEVARMNRRACVGRLFFTIPGGIVHGQYFLNVKFENSLLRAPFRILTEEEEKFLGKNYGDIKKQVKEAFFPTKK